MKMTDQAFTKAEHLIHLFTCNDEFPLTRKYNLQGYYVTGKIRREILCSYWQGKLQLNSGVRTIMFESLGDGVYLAKLNVVVGEES